MPPSHTAHTQPTERLTPQQVQPLPLASVQRVPSRRRLVLVTLMVVGVGFTVALQIVAAPLTALLFGVGAACIWLIGFIFVML